MKELDSSGIFWLPDHENDPLSGRLTYSPTGNIMLTLIGDFQNSLRGPKGTIFGTIKSGEVTLLDCFSKGVWRRIPGISESGYIANSMLLGHIFEEPEPLFLSARVRFSDVDSWIGRTPLDDRDLQDLDNNNSKPTVKIQPIEDSVCSFSRGKITVRHVWNYRDRSIAGLTLYQEPHIHIQYDSPTPFKEIAKDVGRLESFITLCIDASIDLDEFVVRHPDIRVQMLSGDFSKSQRDIEYRAPRLKYRTPAERKERQSFDFLISFDEAGGVNGLAQWLDSSARFQRALDSCMSTRHATRMYAENRFLNITYAAEAFHRITQGGTYMEVHQFDELMAAYMTATPPEHKEWFAGRMTYGNDSPLPKRLRELAVIAKGTTRPMIGKEGRWAQTIAQVRNELTHLGEWPSKLSGNELYFLSESVYSVLRVAMLLESGVPQAVLDKKRTSNPVTWHADRIEAALTHAREALGLSRSTAE